MDSVSTMKDSFAITDLCNRFCPVGLQEKDPHQALAKATKGQCIIFLRWMLDTHTFRKLGILHQYWRQWKMLYAKMTGRWYNRDDAREVYKVRVLEARVNVSRWLITHDLVHEYDFKNILCSGHISAAKTDNERGRPSYRSNPSLGSRYLELPYRAPAGSASFNLAYCGLYIISIGRVGGRSEGQTRAGPRHFAVEAGCVRRARCDRSSTARDRTAMQAAMLRRSDLETVGRS